MEELKSCLRRYVEAKRKSSLSRDVSDSEAEKLFSYFQEYVRSRRDEEVQSFADVLDGFYSVLGLGSDIENRNIRSSLTKRFKRLVRKYNASDSGSQRKLDEFYY